MSQNKKLIWVIVALLIVAGFAYWGSKRGWWVKNEEPAQSTNKNLQVLGGQIPPEMPKDIILPKDASILSSYNYKMANGQTLSTVIYSTPKPANVLAQYRDYLLKNGWQITNGKSPNAAYSIYATKSGMNISVFLSGGNVTLSLMPATK